MYFAYQDVLVGGMKNANEFAREIECFDEASGTWSIIAKTEADFLLSGHVLVVIWLQLLCVT